LYTQNWAFQERQGLSLVGNCESRRNCSGSRRIVKSGGCSGKIQTILVKPGLDLTHLSWRPVPGIQAEQAEQLQTGNDFDNVV
jgi:hypothetical protein